MSETNERSVAPAGSAAWRFAAALSIVFSIAACLGCDRPDTKRVDGLDFKYRVVTVEGRKWIAYQGAHGFTHLAGPIDDK